LLEEKITVQGQVISDPVKHETEGKAKVVTFVIKTAVQRFDLRINSYTQGQENNYIVVAYNRLGRNVLKSVKKGDRVVVVGNLYLQSNPRDGISVLYAEIRADVVGHDLGWQEE